MKRCNIRDKIFSKSAGRVVNPANIDDIFDVFADIINLEWLHVYNQMNESVQEING